MYIATREMGGAWPGVVAAVMAKLYQYQMHCQVIEFGARGTGRA
jgi:hypothetical protein